MWIVALNTDGNNEYPFVAPTQEEATRKLVDHILESIECEGIDFSSKSSMYGYEWVPELIEAVLDKDYDRAIDLWSSYFYAVVDFYEITEDLPVPSDRDLKSRAYDINPKMIKDAVI